MFQSDNKQSSLGTILAPEIDIKGDINVSGNIIVYGTVHGNIISNGTVNTAKGSVIDGNIKAQATFISGEVNGDVDVDNKVVLGPSCKLMGNIKASIIETILVKKPIIVINLNGIFECFTIPKIPTS